MTSSKVLEAIAVTAELCGRTFSPAAAAMFAEDLSGFPDRAVLAALTRCRKEVRGMLTIQDVVSRIDDGRPGVEEAWAMLPRDENTSIVWTEEMAQAHGVVYGLLEEGDTVAARMAFKEAYIRMVTAARDQKIPPKWTPSFGADLYGRHAALVDAVSKNQMTLDHAVLIAGEEAGESIVRQLGITQHPLLAAPNPEGRAKIKALLADLHALPKD